MTSITAPISVGKWVTTPVLANSKVTVPQSTMPTMPMIRPNPPKNGSGLVFADHAEDGAHHLMPSPTVSSLDTEPSGRSRYWIGIS